MTDLERTLLKNSIDEVVELETTAGDRYLAQILFVFDEGDTPDVFFVKVSDGPGGTFIPEPGAGHSVLLSDIAAVRRHEDEPT
jgi:hypothetical protein